MSEKPETVVVGANVPRSIFERIEEIRRSHNGSIPTRSSVIVDLLMKALREKDD